MERNKIVEELKKEAIAVGAQRDRCDAAAEEVKRATAGLLDDVVDAVKPALKAMCNRVTAAWDGERAIQATFRGIHLWGMDPTPTARPTRGIYLSEHADLLLATYDIDTPETWSAEFGLLTARQVVDMVGDDLPSMLDKIALSLAAQAKGAAPRKTEKFLGTADRIRAAALILRTS